MNVARFVAAGTVLLVVVGCGGGSDASSPTAPAPTVAASQNRHPAPQTHVIQASGHYDAQVDFSTLTLKPFGPYCQLDVDGQFVFTGTIVGTAKGHTTALVFATCAQVAAAPPGTDRDSFTSWAEFHGTVDGVPADADLLYIGGVQPGGAINAKLVFYGGVAGVLETANARVAVGGDYYGPVVMR